MNAITYQIELFDYWHIGSGLTGAADTNSVVKKDDDDLPYIPGKILKGLLSEAANHIDYFSNNKYSTARKRIFGIGADYAKDHNANLDETDASWIKSSDIEGKCNFGSATLTSVLAKKINQEQLSPMFYDRFSATKIDEDSGVALDQTLRTMEVTLPISLFAKIENVEDTDIEFLNKCLQWTKRLGVNRNHGLGRCRLTKI